MGIYYSLEFGALTSPQSRLRRLWERVSSAKTIPFYRNEFIIRLDQIADPPQYNASPKEIIPYLTSYDTSHSKTAATFLAEGLNEKMECDEILGFQIATKQNSLTVTILSNKPNAQEIVSKACRTTEETAEIIPMPISTTPKQETPAYKAA